jgi:outer membrane protein OmpA-like peptidoglycan-associated protein
MRNFVFYGALSLLLWTANASAQRVTELDRYRPAELATDGFGVGSAQDQGHLNFGARIELDYARNPLVLDVRNATPRYTPIVENQLVVHGVFSLGLWNRLVVTAGLPVTLWSNGEAGPAGLSIPGADGTALGDAWVGARVRLFGERTDMFALGLAATLSIPTADLAASENAYAGSGLISGHFRVLGDLRFHERFRLSFDAGFLVRENSSLSYASLGHALTYGVDLAFPIILDGANERLVAHADLRGSILDIASADRETNYLELLLGLKYHHESGFRIGAAAGPGLTRGIGTPDARALLMVGYASPSDAAAPADTDGDGLTDDVDQCPAEPEDRDNFQDTDGCPDPDNDNDGILDGADQCPNEAETVNQYQDEDGCPDEIPDTDGDGILDNVDQCATEPEDRDGFEDENGCPDPDNDADGVLDGADRCPLVAGVAANNGCPDSDRDGDGVVDRLDNCPDEAGTAANNGCRERQLVVITDGALEIRETVYFKLNKDTIERRSFTLLENVRAVLAAHPEIANITVEGHTDARGDADRNRDLSQRRAQAVVTWLTGRGLEASRFTARGFGPDQPIVANARNEREHAQNRRVIFRIATPTQTN